MESAIECASKVAYLVSVIKINGNTVERYNKNIDIQSLLITDPIYSKKFKGIKKFSPKAYYYLYKALELNPLN